MSRNEDWLSLPSQLRGEELFSFCMVLFNAEIELKNRIKLY